MLILRMAFLAPAVADFALSALTLHRMAGIADDSLLPRGQFAGVAFCWGLLLLMGFLRPAERAWILGPTGLVIGCIAAGYLYGFLAGVVETANLALALVICGAMIWLCWRGLVHAKYHVD